MELLQRKKRIDRLRERLLEAASESLAKLTDFAPKLASATSGELLASAPVFRGIVEAGRLLGEFPPEDGFTPGPAASPTAPRDEQLRSAMSRLVEELMSKLAALQTFATDEAVDGEGLLVLARIMCDVVRTFAVIDDPQSEASPRSSISSEDRESFSSTGSGRDRTDSGAQRREREDSFTRSHDSAPKRDSSRSLLGDRRESSADAPPPLQRVESVNSLHRSESAQDLAEKSASPQPPSPRAGAGPGPAPGAMLRSPSPLPQRSASPLPVPTRPASNSAADSSPAASARRQLVSGQVQPTHVSTILAQGAPLPPGSQQPPPSRVRNASLVTAPHVSPPSQRPSLQPQPVSHPPHQPHGPKTVEVPQPSAASPQPEVARSDPLPALPAYTPPAGAAASPTSASSSWQTPSKPRAGNPKVLRLSKQQRESISLAISKRMPELQQELQKQAEMEAEMQREALPIISSPPLQKAGSPAVQPSQIVSHTQSSTALMQNPPPTGASAVPAPGAPMKRHLPYEADAVVNYSGSGLVSTKGYRVEVGSSHVVPTRPLLLLDPDSYRRHYEETFMGREHTNFIAKEAVKRGGPCVLSIIGNRRAGTQVAISALVRTKKEDRLFSFSDDIRQGDMTADQMLKNFKKLHPAYSQFNFKKVAQPEIEQSLYRFEKLHYKGTFKFGVLFVSEGQGSNEDDIYNNCSGSQSYEDFLSLLGRRVDLNGWKRYRAGLDCKEGGATGSQSLFTDWHGFEIMFHVATMLPLMQGHTQQIERKRHIGNDAVVLVYVDGSTPFDPACIRSEFNHVFLVVRPDTTTSPVRYKLSVLMRAETELFPPAFPKEFPFPGDEYLRDLVLSKLVNSSYCALKSPTFVRSMEYERVEHLRDLLDVYW